MRRFLAALAVLPLAAPAAAQETPEWVGVWEGRVGTYPVRLCMDVFGDSPGRGSYYYLSRLEPIALSEADGEGGWIERAVDGEAAAQWAFAELTGERMRGTWRQRRRSLPFELTPAPWAEGDWGGACSSDAFIGPRMSGGEVVEKPGTFEGWGYTEHGYSPPAHLAEDVSIVTFTYPGSQPGDAAINAALGAYLPSGGIGDNVYECLAGAIASLGTDGFFALTLTPVMVSDAYLVVEESAGDFCGGAHPNHSMVRRTFDRRSGEELDLSAWLDWPPDEGEGDTMPPALRALVLARWPVQADPECREFAAEASYWTFGLTREGLEFQPDFPHALSACEEPVVVDWPSLTPLLNAEGRAGLARLRSG